MGNPDHDDVNSRRAAGVRTVHPAGTDKAMNGVECLKPADRDRESSRPRPWLLIVPLLLCACAPAAVAAGADEAAYLGQLEGSVAFCSRVHPDLAALLQERLHALLAAAEETELAQARALPAYQQRFDAVVAELERQGEPSATKACTAFANGS